MGNLIKAMEELQSIEKVNIKGKEYATVASRVGIFRKYFPSHSIVTDIVVDDEQRVVIKASIFDENNRLISTGYAEEIRGQGLINTTSAIENAETSAIGRALAAFGLIGGEYASSNEVENAIAKQNNFQNSNTSKPASTDIKSIIQQENEKLKEANLSVLLKDDMLIIQGKSFGHQNLIKKLGYKWNPSKKVWYKPLLQKAS
jgi:deoxycytidylate deaminase